jgi:ATP-dependent RNA helicase RhlE
MSFCSLGLCDELLNTVKELGYTSPSPIQIDAIPAILNQHDVMAVAQTGTGKTASFTLPILQLLSAGSEPQPQSIRALIITPTRELAAQVYANVQRYSRHLTIRSSAAFGGMRIEPQILELQAGLDVLVATPGRLLDLYQKHAVDFEQLQICVFDEADRMLDLGFIDDIRHIQSLLPSNRQTLMFSATFSKEISLLAKGMLTNPQIIEITAANTIVDTITQTLYPVIKAHKAELLTYLIKINSWRQVLVFSKTKQGADHLVTLLNDADISADSIHANRTQHARTLALDAFKKGRITVLVATDIASRGIDINQLPYVVNFDLPYVAEDYVHRIGRTGRVGTLGLAVSFFSDDESKQLHAIEQLIGYKLERKLIPGFAPIGQPKQPISSPYDDDEFGNFEADSKPSPRGKSSGRRTNGRNSAKRNRHR